MSPRLDGDGHPPDAIFCANDMMAVGCFDALRELGLPVPQDVSVIGFDDREIAAELLINAAGGLKAGPTQIKVECTLVVRDSVD